MSFIDTATLAVLERRLGWRGRAFDSSSMTFDAGASIHQHHHPEEEVWHILEGEVEISILGETRRAGPGFVGIVPPGAPHSVRAITSGRAIVTDFPRGA
jgi:quercetin dioxygenase-like cupin family protein